MARRHGRNGSIYVGATAAAQASPLAYASKWTLNFETDDEEVTAFSDPNKVYVAGLPDAQGTFSGFYDSASAQAYTAATDGAARKVYLYVDLANDPGVYWFGTALFDFSIETGVGESAKVSGSFKAASPFFKVG